MSQISLKRWVPLRYPSIVHSGFMTIRTQGRAMIWYLALTVPALILATAGKTYTNDRFHYSVTIPIGWNVVKNGDVPYISDYPNSEVEPHGQLPPGRAAILVIPLELYRQDGITTIDQWIQSNMRVVEHLVARRTVSNPTRDSGRASVREIVRSVSQLSPEDPKIEELRYYFLLRGNAYQAFLEYHVGDPRAASYEGTLKTVVSSIHAQ